MGEASRYKTALDPNQHTAQKVGRFGQVVAGPAQAPLHGEQVGRSSKHREPEPESPHRSTNQSFIHLYS